MLIQILIFGSGFVFGVKNKNYRRKLRSIKTRALKAKPPHLDPKGKDNSLKGHNIPAISGEASHQKMQQVAASNGKKLPNPSEMKLNRNIRQSISLMGLSLIGTWFYAPLLPVTGIGTLYLFLPVLKNMVKNLKQRRITTELVESVSIIGFLLSGYFFLAIFTTFTSLLCLKLLARVEARSKHQLIDAFNTKKQRVWVLKEGSEIEVPLETIQEKDIVIANAGEIIPVDGVVTWGLAIVDQQILTGESQPVEKEVGGKVFAATLVLSGRILINVETTGFNTDAAKIGQILEQTLEYKESLRLRGKQIADGFTAPTLVVSGLALPLLGPSAAMAVVWSGFGYDMKQYGPISVLNFLHIMAKNGILIKDGRSLEMLQQVDTLVFDKTGTLTMEQPQLSYLHPLQPFDEDTLLTYAATAEYRQTHPIARAILAAAKQRGLDIPNIEEAAYQVGYGIEVRTDAAVIQAGSARFMRQKGIHLPNDIQQLKTRCDTDCHTLVYIAVDNTLAGVLELQPRIRPEARDVIRYLKAQNISLTIISGDHEQPTRELARELGIQQYYAETLPAQKAELIKELRQRGKFVAYIGDGINDAIALKQANVSISLSGASTAATDTAQIVLMDGDLRKLKTLFKLSRSFENNMRTNYLNSMIPGVITLGGVFLFGMGIAGSLGVYFTAKFIGLANTMLPLVKHRTSGSLTPIEETQPALLPQKKCENLSKVDSTLHAVITQKN
jgi:Cu2+-exporting ATPase